MTHRRGAWQRSVKWNISKEDVHWAEQGNWLERWLSAGQKVKKTRAQLWAKESKRGGRREREGEREQKEIFLTPSHVEHWPAVPNRPRREGALWEFAQPNRKSNLQQLQAVQHKWVIRQQSDEQDDRVRDLRWQADSLLPSVSSDFPDSITSTEAVTYGGILIFLVPHSALLFYCHSGAMMRHRQTLRLWQLVNGWLILLTCTQASVRQLRSLNEWVTTWIRDKTRWNISEFNFNLKCIQSILCCDKFKGHFPTKSSYINWARSPVAQSEDDHLFFNRVELEWPWNLNRLCLK